MTLYPQVRVGNAEVYVSGTVICRAGQIIEITPLPTAIGAYRIEIAVVDNAFAPSGTHVENLPDNLVRVTLTNYGPNTTSTKTAIHIGTFQGKPLYLDALVVSTGAGAGVIRTVTYTVLQGTP